MENTGGWNFKYTTRDIVIIAVIAAIAGVVNTGMGNVWYLLNSSVGPLGGALLQGSFMWAYILVMWLVRKPGAALFLGIIETAVELLLGNAAGVGTLGWGLFQGLGVEGVMAISNYRNYRVVGGAHGRGCVFTIWHRVDRDPLWLGSCHRQRCLARHADQYHIRHCSERFDWLLPGQSIGKNRTYPGCRTHVDHAHLRNRETHL